MVKSLLNRVCKQTAVYWGTPTADGYGGFTFADPSEIKVRWEDTQKKIRSSNGEEIISSAVVHCLQDLDEGGYLYLGSESGLDSNHDDPKQVDDAYEIKKFEKIPKLGSTGRFIRKVYL